MRDRVLDRKSFPMRLWRKARAHGSWDPGDIDFSLDRLAWAALPLEAQTGLRHLCALFLAGERAVTLNLLPFLHLVASEARLEEELYLTSFLSDEAKHVDLFCLFFEDLIGEAGELPSSGHQGYQRILDEELKSALTRLYTDASPEAQIRASVTYNIAVEGIMADTGQYLLRRMLAARGVFPGMQQGLEFLHRDESRHIAYGLYFLSRLIVEHGNRAYKTFLDRMSELKVIIEEATHELIECSGHESVFGVSADELMRFSQRQFANRMQRILRARTQTLPELEREDIP
jgi:ribonucleoside-diphosphate reductase beta chain